MARKTKRKRYNESEIRLIAKMVSEGASDREISRTVGRTVRAIYTCRNKLKRGIPISQTVHTPKTMANTTEHKALVDLIVHADNVPRDQKLKVLEILL